MHIMGDPALRQAAMNDPYPGYREVPLMFDYRENSRALGLSDMCKAIETGRPFRANSHSSITCWKSSPASARAPGKVALFPLKTKYERTMPMKNNPMHGILDE